MVDPSGFPGGSALSVPPPLTSRDFDHDQALGSNPIGSRVGRVVIQ